MTQHNTYHPTAPMRALVCLGTLFVAGAFLDHAAAAGLDIEIYGFPNDSGKAVVQVFASSENYTSGSPDMVYSTLISNGLSSLNISKINHTYALVVHQDSNLDGQLPTFLFGVLLEPVGYSNSFGSGLFRPDWKQVSYSPEINPTPQLIRVRTNAIVAFAHMLAVGLPSLLAVFFGLAAVRWARVSFSKSSVKNEVSND